MSPSTVIGTGTSSAAAIVGTAPTPVRSAGDGSAAAESFAQALNQANSPPPAAPPAPNGVEDEAEAEAVSTAAQASTGTPPRPSPTDSSPASADPASLVAAWLAGSAAGKLATPAAGAARAAHARPSTAGGGAGPVADAAAVGTATAQTRHGEAGAGALAVAAPVEREAVLGGPAHPLAGSTPATAAAPLSSPLLASAGSTGNAAANLPTDGRLQPSPGSAEFAPALGAQLNVFVRDGVQHARLHLHPAELGPLTVQIQLDGATAQVRLAAEHPLTRQALEQAMPTLAGALRESGLTLTGGGVFEQPANPQQQGDRAPAGGRSTTDTTTQPSRDANDATHATTEAALRAPWARRGVVDLVA